MPQITGGRVVYRRSIQPQPYESEGAEIEFQFIVEDDENPTTAAASVLRIARAEVHIALGLRKGVEE